MSLKCLPQSTVKLIGSSQVITSVSAAVKELVENSLDAGAFSVDVKLENHGMDKIEVRDDGSGISKDDVPLMCKKSHTSKISSFADLDGLSSYGFRGEALYALCAVGKLCVTTKTDADSLAYTYYFSNDGSVIDSKPSHINKGTIILVEGLFKNLPVRRQYLTNGRRRSEEIKKVESVLKSLAIIHPRLRLTFTHNKFLIWQKNSVASLKQSLAQAIPPTIISQLDSLRFTDEALNFELDVLLPRKDCNISVACVSCKEDAFLVFINSRPVRHKELEKVVENEMTNYFGHYIPANKFPICLLSIKLSANCLDVNLEPNKTKVLVKDLDSLLDKIKGQFLKFYTGIKENDATTPVDIKLPKRKLDTTPSKEKNKVPKIENLSEDTQQLNTKDDLNPNPSLQCVDGVFFKVDSNQGIYESSTSKEKFVQNKSTLSPNDSIQDEKTNLKTFNNGDNVANSLETDMSTNKEATLAAQDFDELEFMLATSTQSSILVEPDVNAELDIFASSEVNSSQNADDCESDISSCSKINEENRDNIICEFVSGLPIKDLPEENELTLEALDPLKNRGIPTNHKNSNANDTENGINKNNDLDLDKITLSQWSKGHVLNTVSIPVTSEARLPSPTVKNDEDDFMLPDTDFKIECDNKTNVTQLMDRSVSSQMGSKKLSAFTTFAKEMRVKLLKQSPGMSFTRVASELATMWKDLADDEKNHYKESSGQEKVKSVEKRPNTPELKSKKPTFKPKSTIELSKGLKKMKYDDCVEVNTSVVELRSRLDSRCCRETNHPRILCKLSEDLYCFSSDSSLSVLSVMRLNEVINYYKNMATMMVPLKVLETNISVKAELVGEKNWHTLQCLETSLDLRNNTIVVDNELITKNGFRIEVNEGIGGKQFEITDVPTHVSFYGIEDLKELLQLMDKHGTTASLIECRPLKIASYIRGETIRMCSNLQLNFESKGLDSMFNFWLKNVNKIYPNCPHHKPVSKELFKFHNSS